MTREDHDSPEPDDGLDDRELPDEADMDREDDTDPDDLVPCPHCKKKIYEDSEFCPHCGKYLSAEDSPWSSRLWTIVIVAAVLFGMFFLWMVMPR